MKKWIWWLMVVVALAACETAGPRRVVVDQSGDGGPPEWVHSSRSNWEDGTTVMYRGTSTLWGDERLDGCYQLAKLNAKEALLSEISEEVKGAVDHATQGLSEEAENVLNLSRSTKYQGNLSGLRFTEEYYERYVIKDDERIECFVLGAIKRSDYNKVRRRVLTGVAAVDSRVREAMMKRQIQFFDEGEEQAVVGAPARPAALPAKRGPANAEGGATAAVTREPAVLESADHQEAQ